MLRWAVALAFPGLLAAQDYFPLQVGNQWIYRGGGIWADKTLALEITRSQDFNGINYALLHGFDSDYWLREDENGAVFQYDPTQNQEKLWYAFGASEGETYQESLPACCGHARIASRQATYTGPIGFFDYALEIQYPGVFQLGITRELFLPYVGMLRREQNTGGPSFGTWDLIYARLGGITVISEKHLSFELTLDRAVYVANLMPPVDPRSAVPRLTARLTIRNTQDQPLQLTFPSGQIYDLTLKNEKGAVVYRWSAGMMFAQIVHVESYGPGEKNYVVVAPLTGADGQALPPGNYVAEGWLTTAGARAFAASVGFQVQQLE